MTDVVLAINSGSSSLKFAIYPADLDSGAAPLLSGKATGIGEAPQIKLTSQDGPIAPVGALQDIPKDADHEWILGELLKGLKAVFGDLHVKAAGHRVVHGGQDYATPVVIDPSVRASLQALVPLAPLHQPHNLAAIDAVEAVLPGVLHVACFDTAFHRTQPRISQLFGLPRRLSDAGILRYGFHGLSYDYIASVMPEVLGPAAQGRVIVAHLGNGASMCAMKDGKSVATSMGFTALDGLIMGCRSGTIDPGVVLYLLTELGMSVPKVEHVLYHESGLLGVSGISNNMKTLESSEDPNAKEAIELFCHRAACEIGALTAALGGLDALVFTAGIGENSSFVRSRICEKSRWLGVLLDNDANAQGATKIASADSRVDVAVIATNEESVIADWTRRLLHRS